MADADVQNFRGYKRTTHAVWELTLRCNLSCAHCGSRAGRARDDELSTQEAIGLVHQLAAAGMREVSLIGGEVYLRGDWLEIAAEIVACGMRCSITTGGYGVSREIARRMAGAGVSAVSVSVDGLEQTHDLQRGRVGSYRQALSAIEHCADAGLFVGCNTQVNRLSAPELPMLYDVLKLRSFRAWQLQLTVPMGNAVDHWRMILAPCELLDVYPMIAYLASRARDDEIDLQPGNNIGYYGPYERLLRGDRKDGYFQGCAAGVQVLGIEANGSIKGCPSLPTAAYTGGNIRERPLDDILENAAELTFNRLGVSEARARLWGRCAECRYAAVCRGGCTWTAHVFFDTPGNNPYCHHRALALAKRGLRERVELQHRPLLKRAFDNGLFRVIEEPLDAPWPESDTLRFTSPSIQWPARWLEEDPGLRTLVASERAAAIDTYPF